MWDTQRRDADRRWFGRPYFLRQKSLVVRPPERDTANPDSIPTEKIRLHIGRDARRPQRFSINAAPARLDLGKNFLTTIHNRIVK
jgi:hypothetical protein